MRTLDYSFLKTSLLPAGLLSISSGIAGLKNEAKHRKEDYLKVFTEIEAVARIQSVKSSNEIETEECPDYYPFFYYTKTAMM